MSSVEGYLTRELDIRFIDAREITNEAKMMLGIIGYPTKQEMVMVRKEAMQLFNKRSEEEKQSMRRLSTSLDAVKSMHSMSSHASSECGDSSDTSSSVRSSSKRGWLKRTFSSD